MFKKISPNKSKIYKISSSYTLKSSFTISITINVKLVTRVRVLQSKSVEQTQGPIAGQPSQSSPPANRCPAWFTLSSAYSGHVGAQLPSLETCTSCGINTAVVDYIFRQATGLAAPPARAWPVGVALALLVPSGPPSPSFPLLFSRWQQGIATGRVLPPDGNHCPSPDSVHFHALSSNPHCFY